jgi:hypothetical protein
MPRGAVGESLDRISGVFRATGIPDPGVKILINLTPPDVPKDGTWLDLLTPSLRHTTRIVPQPSHGHWYKNWGAVNRAGGRAVDRALLTAHFTYRSRSVDDPLLAEVRRRRQTARPSKATPQAASPKTAGSGTICT